MQGHEGPPKYTGDRGPWLLPALSVQAIYLFKLPFVQTMNAKLAKERKLGECGGGAIKEF